MQQRFWIMKSEPGEFSIDDLKNQKENFWDGVRNYTVRNMFRDNMRVGDLALFYHSSTKDIGVVGEMKIIKPVSADPTQFDKKSKYYDSKSSKDNPRWLGPTVRFVKKFKNLVSLTQLREDKIFSDLPLVQKGNRLSVVEISKKQFARIVELGK